jgi:hypothetical protein
MRNLEIDSTTTLAHVLNELKNTEEDGLEITVVPGEKSILDNSLDKSIIEKVAKKFSKEVVFPETPIGDAPIADEDNLGFVEGEDIISKTPMQEVQGMIKPAAAVGEGVSKGRKFSIPFKFPKNKWALVAVGLLVLMVLLLSSVYFLPSAQVNLIVEGENKDSQATIIASATAKEIDEKTNIVPLEFAELAKEDSDEANTTGTKTIGNPAKGRVNIYNRLGAEKNYPAGTIITPVATSSATFRLDSAVLVPAAVPPAETSVGVNVTATKVGPEGNLGASTSFKIGSADVSEVYAKNDIAFSGGSTKEAQVASTEDRDKLKNSIIETLSEEAEKEILKKHEGTLIPEGALEENLTKETFDPKAVDAEATKLKVTVAVTFKANLIKESDVKKLLVSMLEKAEKGAKVDPDSLEVKLEQLEKNADGSLKILVKYKTTLVPELDKNEISRQLEGKTLMQAGSYLDTLDKVAAYEVTISPSVFRFVGFMPFSKDRIKVNFRTQ